MASRGRSRLETGLVALAFFVVAIGPVNAQEPQPTVRIESSMPPSIILGCDDDDPPSVHAGEVVISRTGDTTGALTVIYDLMGMVEATSGSAVFPPGDDTEAPRVP